ncbi:MAG: hypothetical protein KJN93_10635 [Alphaproteobacteria bacterium]|nr:hypothetical protein [Alphaproteobacteria bacterium]NNF25080.1 hypothetical protein [Paracoccaceae bacterium]
MSLPRKIVLKLPLCETADLGRFVEDCLAANVSLVAVRGEAAASVEDKMERLINVNGTDETRFFTTSAHAAADDAIDFARAWDEGEALRIMAP